jgi:hypothetical protein
MTGRESDMNGNAPKQRTQRWRDLLEIHPAAELLPMMSTEELRDPGEDIKKRGLISRIVLWSPGTREGKDKPIFLLDGRNRLDAMELAGVRVVRNGKLDEFVLLSIEHLYGEVRRPDAHFPQPGVDPWEFVLSANVRRRHLTNDQKREIVAAILRAHPEKSDRQIGQLANVSKNTAKSVREGLERRGQIDHVSKRTDTRGRQQPAERPKPKAEPHQLPRRQVPTAVVSAAEATNAAVPVTATEMSQETDRLDQPLVHESEAALFRDISGAEARNEQLQLRDLYVATLRDADRSQRILEVLTITSELGLTIRDLEVATSLETDTQGPGR